MKRILFLLLCGAVSAGAQTAISLGSAPDGAGGDNNRQAFTKVNTNFTNIYARTITIAGTAGEITSSAGAQSLAGDRTWTLSLPTALTFTGKTVTGGTFVGPALGTPTALVGTNITGTAASLTAGTASAVAVGGITGLGTGVGTALAINVGSAGAPVVLNGAGGTPSAITLTNGTGLPVSGIAASTATALGVGSVELGHASDTTLARSAAGAMTLEGVAVATATNTLTVTAKTMQVSAALGTDDTLEGVTIAGLNNSGGVTQWDSVYLNSSSQWVLADANGSGTFPCRGLATATVATANASTVVTRGTVRNDAWNWTPGGAVYLSTTAGGLTQTAPSATTEIVQVIGYALTADILFVNITGEYLTLQ